jgi:two-component system LytT family response regulator
VIRALIVDDEPLARQGVRVRLEREADIEVVAEADDGAQAVEAIRRHRPDLVFLDVQMPGLNGFQVLEQVARDYLPVVVFVTAHDVHALQAFEINALDYLLKPYSEERFQESLRRVRRELDRAGGPSESERLRSLLETLAAQRLVADRRAFPPRFAVRERDRIVLVRAEDLDAVEAAGNYVSLVVGGRKHLLRLTLADMELQLDPARFARIHRSTIVNFDRVRELRPEPHGDCDVVLESGAVYRLSRAYRERVLPRLRPEPTEPESSG